MLLLTRMKYPIAFFYICRLSYFVHLTMLWTWIPGLKVDCLIIIFSFIIALAYPLSSRESFFSSAVSILMDRFVLEKLPFLLQCDSDLFTLLYAVNPLSNLSCVTCSSSFFATFLLVQTHIHPLLILLLLWEGPLDYHGVLSYLLQDSYSSFVPFLLTVLVGVYVIPLFVRQDRSFCLFYFSLLFYPKGFHSLSVALPVLFLKAPGFRNMLICSLIALSITLFYELRVGGSDIFAMQFYVNCATFVLVSTSFVKYLLSPLC